MELRHLRYLVVVADELHFSRAAARLNMSQPPLSQQIRQLEEELGVDLFVRTKRNVQLTEAGRVFVDEARGILAQVERAKRRATQVARGTVGHLTIATVTSLTSGLHLRFLEILQSFSNRHPSVHVNIHHMNTTAQIEAIRNGSIQVGFLTTPSLDDDIAMEEVERVQLVAALPESHPLASRKTLHIRDVAAEPIIMLSRQSNPKLHDLILSWCSDSGCILNIEHETNSMHMSLTQVAMGAGVCLVTSSFARAHLPGVAIRKIQGPVPELISGAAYKRGTTTRTVTSFLKVVREVVDSAQKPKTSSGASAG